MHTLRSKLLDDMLVICFENENDATLFTFTEKEAKHNGKKAEKKLQLCAANM